MGLFNNGWEHCSQYTSVSDSLDIRTPSVDTKLTNSPWERGGKGEESAFIESEWKNVRGDF